MNDNQLLDELRAIRRELSDRFIVDEGMETAETLLVSLRELVTDLKVERDQHRNVSLALQRRELGMSFKSDAGLIRETFRKIGFEVEA